MKSSVAAAAGPYAVTCGDACNPDLRAFPVLEFLKGADPGSAALTVLSGQASDGAAALA